MVFSTQWEFRETWLKNPKRRCRLLIFLTVIPTNFTQASMLPCSCLWSTGLCMVACNRMEFHHCHCSVGCRKTWLCHESITWMRQWVQQDEAMTHGPQDSFIQCRHRWEAAIWFWSVCFCSSQWKCALWQSFIFQSSSKWWKCPDLSQIKHTHLTHWPQQNTAVPRAVASDTLVGKNSWTHGGMSRWSQLFNVHEQRRNAWLATISAAWSSLILVHQGTQHAFFALCLLASASPPAKDWWKCAVFRCVERWAPGTVGGKDNLFMRCNHTLLWCHPSFKHSSSGGRPLELQWASRSQEPVDQQAQKINENGRMAINNDGSWVWTMMRSAFWRQMAINCEKQTLWFDKTWSGSAGGG